MAGSAMLGRRAILMFNGWLGRYLVRTGRKDAERVRHAIDRRGEGHAWRRAVIVTDQQYFCAEGLQHSTVIAIGGPGSNAAAAHFVPDRLDTVFGQEDRFWVQASLDTEPRRLALWGVDSEATAASVTAFLEPGFLDDLLERIWRLRPGGAVSSEQ